MSSQGVISAGGEFTEFESPWDLDSQRILKLRHSGHLVCACNPAEELAITVVQHKSLPHVRRLR
jgi:hypothetical protein